MFVQEYLWSGLSDGYLSELVEKLKDSEQLLGK